MAFKKTAGTPIAGLGSSTGELLNLEADETTGALKVATYVWDSDLLQWVRAAQGGGGDAGFTAEDTLFEWDSDGNPLYKGMNATAGAAQGDPSWRVVKYYWDGSGNLSRQEGPLVGSWTGRASLPW